MFRSELIRLLADEYPHLLQKDCERTVIALFDEISGALVQRSRVELRGFGAFSVTERGPYEARNPRNGESVNVPGKRAPYFRTGKELRDKVDY